MLVTLCGCIQSDLVCKRLLLELVLHSILLPVRHRHWRNGRAGSFISPVRQQQSFFVVAVL
jgi:hypothetical protein